MRGLMLDKAFEFVRSLWIKAQLDAPPSAQRTVVQRLYEAKEIARLAAEPRLPIYQLQGQGQGGPLVVTYIGLQFAKPSLKSILFAEEPAEQQIGRIPFWRYGRITSLSTGDIIIIESTKHLIRRLPHQNAIVLPEYVHFILDVRGDWQDVKSRFRKRVRSELRLTRKQGYEYEVSHDDRDFEMFYHAMYLPTMKIRHGALVSPMSAGEAYQHFRRGLLFFVKRDGQRVCGSVCYPKEDIVHFIVVGVLNGDQQLMKDGATGALNCLRIQWANQQGYRAVNFLGAGPYLKGGMFQYKRKWGTTISVPPHLHRRIWIKVRRVTPAVDRFLKENPCIVIDEDGKLHGLIIVDDPHNVSVETKEGWEKHYVTPGLSSLLIRSVSSLAKGPTNLDDPDLVVPISPSSSSGSGQ